MLVFVLGRLLIQLSRMQRFYQQMVVFESAYWALRDMIRDAETAGEPPLGSVAPRLEQSIRVERVSFAYEDAPVLENVSLTIAAAFHDRRGPVRRWQVHPRRFAAALLRPDAGGVWIDGVRSVRSNADPGDG